MPSVSFVKPTIAEINKNEKKYQRIDANMEIMLADLSDLTDDIYKGLLQSIEKPSDISTKRFREILYTKAKIFNIFISGKLTIDKIFDDLEKECAINMFSTSIDKDEIFKKNLCPKFYKELVGKYKIDKDDSIEESYYFPKISKEILEVKYPVDILEKVLIKQLQKHDVNVFNKVKTFVQTDGWPSFFGVVPAVKAAKILRKGMIFIDPSDYPDSDVRLHGIYSHAIQEHMISKLLEGGYLGPLTVNGEPDISERELVQADAWPVKNGGLKGVTCLFDIMRERRPNKLKLLDVYPDEVYGFTSPDFVNQYLMHNPFRFPCLSTILYNQYAHGAFNYFNKNPDFATWSKEEQLHAMNIYDAHTSLSSNIDEFLKQNPHTYMEYKRSGNSAILFKSRSKPLFEFPVSQDDSASYIRARKKAEKISDKELTFHSDQVLLLDGPSLT